LNIKGLKVFMSVMASGSLVSAAREMNTSISALSRQLSMLESQLDLQLFTRDRKKLTPTDRAHAFLPEVERLITAFDDIPAVVQEIKRLPSRRLRIGVMPRMASCIVEPAISRYMKQNPQADISVDILPRRYLERRLLDRTIDIGFGSIPAYHENITVSSICQVPAVVILHPDHAFSCKNSIQLSKLKDEEFITLPPTTLLGRTLGELLDAAGLEKRSRLQVSQIRSCCDFIANGFGISISDTMIPKSLHGSLKLIPLRPEFYFDIGMLYLDGSKELETASTLIQEVHDEAANFHRDLALSYKI